MVDQFCVTESHNRIALIPVPTILEPKPKSIMSWEMEIDPYSFKAEIARAQELIHFEDLAWVLNHPGSVRL